MIRIIGGKTKACLRKLSRQLSDVPTPPPEEFIADLRKHAKAYKVIIALVSAYSVATFTVTKLLLSPLEQASATVSAGIRDRKIDFNNLRLELKADLDNLRLELKDDNVILKTEMEEIKTCLVKLTAAIEKKNEAGFIRMNFLGMESVDDLEYKSSVADLRVWVGHFDNVNYIVAKDGRNEVGNSWFL